MTTDIEISSRAPARIDLSGGTLDIWPLYLFLKNPLTINLAINLYAETKITLKSGSGKIVLKSLDQNEMTSFLITQIKTLKLPPSLEIHFKLFEFLISNHPSLYSILEKKDLTLSTECKSPAGAGLGGSSALCVAILGAFLELDKILFGKEEDFDLETLITIVRDTETQIIRTPAGLQDYYAATYGGLQSLNWKTPKIERIPMSSKLAEKIASRLLLFYSGRSRNSGWNNWELFKGFLENSPSIRNSFQNISDVTLELKNALIAEDWSAVGSAIRAEWRHRKTLAPGISTPEIDQAFATASQLDPQCGSKVCGAGGGGCFFVYFPNPDPKLKDKLIKKFSDFKILHLPFQIDQEGLITSTAHLFDK